MGVSIADVKKWYAGNGLALFHYRNYPFFLLLGTNALTVLCLYVLAGRAARANSTPAASCPAYGGRPVFFQARDSRSGLYVTSVT